MKREQKAATLWQDKFLGDHLATFWNIRKKTGSAVYVPFAQQWE